MRDSGVLQGAADRHTHILFGVDDGIRTLEDALAVLAVEEAAGISDVWCTPHVMEDMPNTTKVLKERFLLLIMTSLNNTDQPSHQRRLRMLDKI